MKIFLLLSILVFSECRKYSISTDSSEAGSSSVESSSESTKLSPISLSTLKKYLKLSPKDESFLKNKFNTSSFDLIWPKSEKEIAQLKICSLKSTLKSQEVKVKIVKISRIKAWYRQDKDKTYCSSDAKSDQSLIPIEFHVSKELANKPRFAKFYPDESQASSSNKKHKALILTHQYLTNSVNLREWFNDKKTTLDMKEMEKILKIFFTQMHAALNSLLEKKFIYTDFKPENVIININNKKGSAFLSNLNSVVSLGKSGKLDKICVMTPEYFPPVNGVSDSDSKKLTSSFIKTEGAKATKRILSWQFCMSIFSLVCQEFEDKKQQFVDRSVFDKWKNENTSLSRYFKCPKSKISTSFTTV
ncbi:hypothetical protein BpHYR1_050088 [Brachionus plicatilis]|uniref:Protein kinase domain-containing protein n=1 Tax=Brachionus plicatilis TaxID=10195 RepID=A0A3M7QWL0_BRAPC|nr:hypothetical protein BpHYR1_050088 [Brachionus plicatilis]